jgi:hypothetical protein
MKSWRWYLLLVVVFCIIGGTIATWPVQPMWSRPMSPSRIIGFLKNGTQVIAPVNQDDPTYIINDVETGAEIRRLKLEYLPDWRMNAIEIMPGDQLFVGWVYVKPGTTHDELNDWSVQRPMVYQVIDISSGKCTVGPFTSYYRSPVTFSPDGKYFWSFNTSTTNGQDLVQTHTGKILFQAREVATRRPLHLFAFSPDCKAVAMQWHNDTKKEHSIEILELPSCKIRFTHLFAPPPGLRPVCMVKAWTDRLYVSGWIRLDPSGWQHPVFSFQVDADKLSDMRIEPLREEYSAGNDLYAVVKDAGDKLVEITYGFKHTGTQAFQWLEQLAQKFGRSVRPSGHTPVSVRTINKATGKTIAHLSSADLVSFRSVLSPDGTRLASWHPTKGMLMWNTQPTPRWPSALGSALLVVLLLQYLRYRFTRKATSAGTPCSPAS